jgi:hypothetical protein
VIAATSARSCSAASGVEAGRKAMAGMGTTPSRESWDAARYAAPLSP